MPELPKVRKDATAVRAVPVGSADTWPKPAPHHPETYDDQVSRAESANGTIWPTETTPFINSERDPTINSAQRIPHMTYAPRGVVSRISPADCACANPALRALLRK